jgi:hypothetical protein
VEEKTDILGELNKLDKIITDAMLRSEVKNCSKKDPTMYSPVLKQSNLEIQYWNVLQKSIRQLIFPIVRFVDIADQMEESTINNLINNNMSATGALENSLKNHNKLVKNGLQHRKEYMDNKLEDEQCKNGKSGLKLKSLIHREESRKNFAAIRRVFKPQHGKGILSIDIPDEENPGKMKTITEPVEMITKITRRNIGHFSQAEGTPFTTQELLDIFGYTGTTQASEALINNQEIPQGLMSQPESVIEIINKLGEGKVKDIHKDITYEEFAQGVKNGRSLQLHHPVAGI